MDPKNENQAQNTPSPAATGATPTQSETVRTFTQAEVDRIVGDRLGREREKFADYETLKAAATNGAALQAQLAAAQQQAAAARIEAALVREAVTAGLTADKLAAALRLADTSGVKVDGEALTGAKEAVAAMLTAYPFLAAPTVTPTGDGERERGGCGGGKADGDGQSGRSGDVHERVDRQDEARGNREKLGRDQGRLERRIA